MKIKFQIIFMVLAIVFACNLDLYASVDDVFIPDTYFKAYLVANFDTSTDGEIQFSEALAVTYMDASSQNIADLTGIESFTNLTYLDCSSNQLGGAIGIDLSSNTNLAELDCSNNNLENLDVSYHSSLTQLHCIGNPMEELNVSDCPNLTDLELGSLPLNGLYVSNCTSLTELDCFEIGSQLSYLYASGCTSLTHIDCSRNGIYGFDISGCTSLTWLDCSDNRLELDELDISTNTSLTDLYCYSNSLDTLDVSYNTNLINLDCSSNQLTSLDVSANTSLSNLECSMNPLTSLDVSANTNLTVLGCSSNQLTNLDVSANTSLISLNCDFNQLTDIPDVASCISLGYLRCRYNYFDSDDCSDILAIESRNLSNFVYNPQYDGSTLDCSCTDLFYRDADGDGYGDSSDSQTACTQPDGYVADDTDADDTDATIHPGATEFCDGKDNDQDGATDENCRLIEPLQDTGQTQCYDNSSLMVSCPAPGADFYGQDAHYTQERSYTKLDATGNDLPDTATSWAMVRNNVTGLTWEVKQARDGTEDYNNPHDADNMYSWYDGITGVQGDGTTTFDTEDFTNALNAGNGYCGYNDWRLPTIRELSQLLYFGQIDSGNATIDGDYFPQTTSGRYWSSSTDFTYDYLTWFVSFSDGDNMYEGTGNHYHARAVRSEQSHSLIDLVDNLDGTITDPNTNLMWQKAETSEMNWQAALSYCENLTLPTVNGYDDWRLPSINELQSLVIFDKYQPRISSYFTDVETWYWSSTSYSGTACIIGFDMGNIGYESKLYGLNTYVRAVRIISPNIKVTPTNLTFGAINVPGSAKLNLTITNNGDANLDISTITISGTDAGLFSLSGTSCAEQTITPGHNCVRIVTFTPGSAGSKTATLTINSNDPDEAQVQVPLSGTGVCTNTFYRDSDEDGYGDPNDSQTVCTQPTGYVTDNTDCNDNDANEHPGQTWYMDADNDGYSNGTTNTTSCTRPTGYKVATELTAISGDCNDGVAAINPGATEVCGDGIDNNCDGGIDEGCCVETTFYRDVDGDGYGDPGNSQTACSQPTGYVTDNTDCNDNDANEHPGQTWYKDADGDGYSDGTTNTTSCTRPTGYKVATELTATSGDCNDGVAEINPGASEVCGDGVDNNCNGETDEGCCVETTFYRDVDGDGYGDAAVFLQACAAPTGYVANNIDCNDCDVNEHPGQTWYQDSDGDGYSSGTTVIDSCIRPNGFYVAGELAATSGDSVDNDNSIYPGAPELYDGIDNNLNGTIDEECSSAGAVKLPDSGQNLYFNNWGPIATPAHGEPFFGQDAQYYHHRSYTKLGLNGLVLPDVAGQWLMVRDNISGLIWEVKHSGYEGENFDNPNDADNRYTWYDSSPDTNGGKPGSPRENTDTEDFITALNLNFYGGFNNWRLPTISEISGLINRGCNSPAINLEFFPQTKPSPYWSSTPYADTDENRAWHIYFGYGYVGDGLTSAKCYVRAVR